VRTVFISKVLSPPISLDIRLTGRDHNVNNPMSVLLTSSNLPNHFAVDRAHNNHLPQPSNSLSLLFTP